MTIESFRAEIPAADVDRLRTRLRATRWPEPATSAEQGVPLAYLQDLCRYWADEYDWRRCETMLNAVPQFRTSVGGLGIHFLHLRSPHPSALPLVMSHGWPGSVLEFLDVVGPLADPPAYGGDGADAFHVVCPSLPGYGFSDKPVSSGWTVQRIAATWAELMAQLGYARYGAYGHDWGNSITTSIGQPDPAHVAGIHVVPPIAGPDPATHGLAHRCRARGAGRSAARGRARVRVFGADDDQTADGGLWTGRFTGCSVRLDRREILVLDRSRRHAGRGDQPRSAPGQHFSVLVHCDRASSARLYWESFEQVSEWFNAGTADVVTVPTGCSIYPKEVPRPSRRWAERRYLDIRYWNELDRGGHFAAMEVPGVFVSELRNFFRLVR